jgi:hypothetical protein
MVSRYKNKQKEKHLSDYFKIEKKIYKDKTIVIYNYPDNYPIKDFSTIYIYDLNNNLIRYENALNDWIEYKYNKENIKIHEKHSCGYEK